MGLIDSILSLIASIIAAVLLGLGALFPAPQVEPPLPAAEMASTSAAFPTAPQEEEVDGQNGLAQGLPVGASPDNRQTEDPRGPFDQQPLPLPTPKPTKSEAQVNDEARAALVNVYCSSQRAINGISGSGVLIDSRGIILTNAHVAQYYLLRDYPAQGNISCTIRIGSPAEPRYTAELLYLPPAWVAQNASQIAASQAVGTGEHDYAFLRITGRTSGEALPAGFPHLAMDRAAVQTGEPMLLASYPAGFLGGETVLKNLYASSAVAYVTRLFTFSEDKSKVDLFSIGGTVVSQGGSSGGASVRLQDGKLAGIIVTATVANQTGQRDLRALALSHIDESLTAQDAGGIVGLLSGDPASKAASFNASVAPGLKQQLLNFLP